MDVLYIIMMSVVRINTLVAYGADPHTHTHVKTNRPSPRSWGVTVY